MAGIFDEMMSNNGADQIGQILRLAAQPANGQRPTMRRLTASPNGGPPTWEDASNLATPMGAPAPAPEINVSSRAAREEPAGPIINNGGITSNANGPIGFEPNRGPRERIGNFLVGPATTLNDAGAASLGYAINADGSLRRSGSPFDQQLNFMNEMIRLGQRNGMGQEQTNAMIQQIAPGLLSNQLGQGQLGLERARAFGIPGAPGFPGATSSPGATSAPGTPGSIANAASDAEVRRQENARFGPEARYDTFWMQAFNAYSPETPPDARMRMMREAGWRDPEFMSGPRPTTPNAAGAPTGVPQGSAAMPAAGAPQGSAAMPPSGAVPPRLNVPSAEAANTADAAFNTGTASFPMGPNRQRVIPTDKPNDPAMHAAITRTMAGLSEENLRDPRIRQRMITTFGPDALDAWLQAPSNIFSAMSQQGRDQQAQIRRFMALGGMQQTPMNPTSAGLGPLQRIANPIALPFNYWEMQR